MRAQRTTHTAGFSLDDPLKKGLPTRCSLARILEYLLASSRVARGKAELTEDIRVLDGQCFLEVLPLTHSIASEEPAIAEPQPNVLKSASSPHSGATTKSVPTFGSSSSRPPTSHG